MKDFTFAMHFMLQVFYMYMFFFSFELYNNSICRRKILSNPLTNMLLNKDSTYVKLFVIVVLQKKNKCGVSRPYFILPPLVQLSKPFDLKRMAKHKLWYQHTCACAFTFFYLI